MLKNAVLVGSLLIGGGVISLPAFAQDFPKKQPIKIVVPVPPGGATDVLARITAEFLQRRIGQTVIVENRPGAGSTIGADLVAKSPADGYTLLFGGSEFAVVPAVRKVPYKLDDFTYLVRAFTISPLILASPKYPPSSTKEMVADMTARPGQLRYGSTGIGAIVHMAFTTIEGAVGAKGLHVPYNGSAPVFNDLLSGTLDVTQGVTPFPDGLKVLGAVGSKRNPVYPNLPTLEELGIKGATWDLWFGFWASPNIPKPLQDRLVAELTAVLKDPDAIAKYQASAKYTPDTDLLTGDAFKKQVLEESRNWKVVADREKIVVQ
jgi:tripartite-type tricarboxylate transporter receptor subunit TctC